MKNQITLQLHYKGSGLKGFNGNCYRLTKGNAKEFGQVIKKDDGWHGEIRVCATGTLVRFAGIWKTRKETIEEIEMLLRWKKPSYLIDEDWELAD